jgi:hypothetical protein
MLKDGSHHLNTFHASLLPTRTATSLEISALLSLSTYQMEDTFRYRWCFGKIHD